MQSQETHGTWFYRHRTGALGPVSSDELRFLARTGKVSAETLVRSSGSEEWIEYAQSPAAFVSRTEERPVAAVAEVLPVKPTVKASEPAGAELTPGNPAVSPTQELTPHDRNMQFVSFATVIALLLLAVLLIVFWDTDPRVKRIASDSPGSEGASQNNGGSLAGITESSETEAGDASDETLAGASNAPAAEAPSSSAEAMPEESPAPATSAEESTADDSAMAENKPAVAENSRQPNPEQEKTPDRDDERFGVALADKAVAKPPEKNAKPKPTRSSLQQSDLGSRTGDRREKALAESGGTVDSEKAVARALQWLRKIQQRDGSWSFQDVGEGAKPGSLDSPLGATAMATLCFLGSGSTTRTGPDKDLVKRAFEFMISQKGSDSDLQGTDSMYVHAIVTLCLTELVTMEPDEKIYRKHAVDAVSYIESAQDPIGGGWRYTFQSPGDTSVTGWDVMALQSGQSGGIKVDPVVVNRAQAFLDSVSDSGGATYCYTPGSPASPSMTAVGLLCRMYLGWPQDSGPLREGIHRLSTIGVSQADMYYNYYSTIALHHYGGTEWEEWNATMRDQLVMTQIVEGAAAGSWPVTDPHGESGGQIYQTCLSVLTLEVYYRYLPLYRP